MVKKLSSLSVGFESGLRLVCERTIELALGIYISVTGPGATIRHRTAMGHKWEGLAWRVKMKNIQLNGGNGYNSVSQIQALLWTNQMDLHFLGMETCHRLYLYLHLTHSLQSAPARLSPMSADLTSKGVRFSCYTTTGLVNIACSLSHKTQCYSVAFESWMQPVFLLPFAPCKIYPDIGWRIIAH